jgi:SAM-dependent methyltransferase
VLAREEPRHKLRSTECAICGTLGNARELYPKRLTAAAFRASTFSARRLPDRLHYRMVKCLTCGLVRADPVAEPELLARLYGESEFSYADEIPNLRRTYRRYLAELETYGAVKGDLLEVGCGNGFFLETALEVGYATVRGVEPSAASVALAAPQIRPYIVPDIIRPGLFGAAEFDVLCMFQVFDHVPNPRELLAECWRVLRPGGFILCLNHNVDALSARVLKERSPIVDVEHTYLYSRRTIATIFAQRGFSVRRVDSALNTYGLRHLAWLAPLPPALKRALLAVSELSPIRTLSLPLPLGNLYLIAQRPA